MPINVPRPIMYEHQEYPKWVTPPIENAVALLVNDEDEERRAMAGEAIEQPEPPSIAPAVFGAPPPPYDHKEYPKWVTIDDKPAVLVDSASQEHALRHPHAKVARETEPDVPTLVERQEADEKALLHRLAEEKGIKIDKRWGLEKLRDIVMSPAD